MKTKAQPIRKGDQFKLEDGVWTVIDLLPGFVDLQCKALHLMIRYPHSVVCNWERA